MTRAMADGGQCAGSEIWVAEGLYLPTPTLGRGIAFELVEGLSLLGGFAGDETEADQRDPTVHEVLLSGDLQRDDDLGEANRAENSKHVVRGLGVADVLVDGFTIEAGYGDDALLDPGAGITLESSGVTLSRLVLRDNVAEGDGGAIHVRGGEVVLRDLAFGSNGATRGSGLSCRDATVTGENLTGGSVGAGVYARDSSVSLQGFSGGGAYLDGGTLEVEDFSLSGQVQLVGGAHARLTTGQADAGHFSIVGSELELIDVDVANGYREPLGGCLHVTEDSRLTMTGGSLTNCRSRGAGVRYGGAALYLADSTADLTAVSIAENTTIGTDSVTNPVGEGYGAALLAEASVLNLFDSELAGSRCDAWSTRNCSGGHLAAFANSEVRAIRTRFLDAWSEGSGGDGGCVYGEESAFEFHGAQFNECFAQGGEGGVLYLRDSPATYVNTLVHGANIAIGQGGAIRGVGTSPQTLIQSSVLGGAPTIVLSDTSPLTLHNSVVMSATTEPVEVAYSCVSTMEFDEEAAGETNRDDCADPMSLVDTGSPDLLPADVWDLDGDGNDTEPLPYDVFGDPRVVGDSVDMGATEAQ
jgi:hypothetical protein